MRKNYLIQMVAGVLALSFLAGCTKKINSLEKPEISNHLPDTMAVSTHAFAATSFTYTVKPTEWMVDGTKIPAGATIYIPAGKRGGLLLKNLQGTSAAPIIVINQGGTVVFSADLSASYGLKTQNSKYFKILGNGDPKTQFGFEVVGGNIGVSMDDFSSDFEIAYFNIHNTGFAGIMAKTDPSCDPATWRGHFTMRNVIIHHNYVHETGGEGLYIGNSFYEDGASTPCGTQLPHDIVNLSIYENITESTGSEGIQVGSVISGCLIYSNKVRNPGVSPFASYQDNGIQIGEGTGGKCYNNLVKNAPGNGIIVLGLGDNILFNNYIINSKGYGIFADSRYTPGPNFQFINNTIVYSSLGGIKLNSETIPMNTVINNAIIQANGSAFAIVRKSTSVKLKALNNYVGTDVNVLGLTNYNSENYRLLSISPLINKGIDAKLQGIGWDFYSKARPSGGTYDIGAAEY